MPYCEKCGTKYNVDAVFCSKCGNNLTKEMASKEYLVGARNEERPILALVLSIISGTIFLFIGLLTMLLYKDVPIIANILFQPSSSGLLLDELSRLLLDELSSALTLISASLIMVGAIMLNLHHEKHKTYGMMIVIFSIIGAIFSTLAFGELYNGHFITPALWLYVISSLITGLAGGILAIRWKPK